MSESAARTRSAGRAKASGSAGEPPSLERERFIGRFGAVSAFLSVAILCAALVVANASSDPSDRKVGGTPGGKEDRLHELTNFHNGPDEQTAAAILRCGGLVVGIGIALFLFWLVRGRGAPARPWLLAIAIVGPFLVAAATLFGFFSLQDVVDTAFARGAPRLTADRASDLFDDSSSLRLAGVFDIGSRIVFAIGIATLSLYAMRLELLTKFLGYWGVGAAIALVIAPIGDAMYIGWLASMGFLAAGWWPGGRPEAWDIPPDGSSRPAAAPA